MFPYEYALVSNFMFENQPVELERDHGSPISAVIIDNEPDITTLAQNANIYDNIISPFDLHNVPAPLPVADALFINYVITFRCKKLPDVFVPLDVHRRV
ncbi:unnamed protein product [Rotaria socialis]|uniref:Uncharacterized protein n=1 Tax=Rotaria socialis TaxID=392032 RepID=A0A818CNJ5_9BILA|nr:unnamed protein product [Rotaria socialis]